jgi:hypothetical protein
METLGRPDGDPLQSRRVKPNSDSTRYVGVFAYRYSQCVDQMLPRSATWRVAPSLSPCYQ